MRLATNYCYSADIGKVLLLRTSLGELSQHTVFEKICFIIVQNKLTKHSSICKIFSFELYILIIKIEHHGAAFKRYFATLVTSDPKIGALDPSLNSTRRSCNINRNATLSGRHG